MDKVCGNHPESLALATCKACDKAICLMCVLDEREGTFCSEGCVQAFRDGVPVPSVTAAATEAAAPAGDPAQSAASTVWEDMPSAEQPNAEFAPPPAEESAPAEPEAPARETRSIPASTKSIGNPCYQHADIRAKAFCAACKRPICGLCIVENPAGMFCSDACAKGLRGRRGLGAGAKVAVVLFLLVVGAGVAVAVKPELLDQLKAMAGMTPDVQPPPPPIGVNPPPPPVPGTQPPKPTPNPVPRPVGTTPKPPPPPVKPPPKPPGPPAPPRPIPPPAPKIVRPEPPKPTRMIHPWQAENPGAWYRIQTVEGGRTALTDIGLKARDAVSYTLQTQDAGGAVRDARTEILPIEILGEERLQIEDRSWTCEVRGTRKADDTYQRSWILVQSRHAGAVLQEDTSEGRRLPVRLWEHTLRVGNRSYDCLVIESEIEGSGRRTKAWYSPAYPLGLVRVESDRGTSALVDVGDAWASRPPLK